MKSRTNLRRQREILPSEKWIDLDKILEPRRRTKLLTFQFRGSPEF
jgi:hypothetical protein